MINRRAFLKALGAIIIAPNLVTDEIYRGHSLFLSDININVKCLGEVELLERVDGSIRRFNALRYHIWTKSDGYLHEAYCEMDLGYLQAIPKHEREHYVMSEIELYKIMIRDRIKEQRKPLRMIG